VLLLEEPLEEPLLEELLLEVPPLPLEAPPPEELLLEVPPLDDPLLEVPPLEDPPPLPLPLFPQATSPTVEEAPATTSTWKSFSIFMGSYRRPAKSSGGTRYRAIVWRPPEALRCPIRVPLQTPVPVPAGATILALGLRLQARSAAPSHPVAARASTTTEYPIATRSKGFAYECF
jgi:hypothetical protein